VTRSNPHRTRAEDAQTRGRVNRDALSLEQALQHWRLAEDRAGIASAQLYLGEQLAVKERWTEAGQRLVEALGGSNDAWLRAESLGNLAHVQWSQGAFQDAEKNFQDAEKLAKQIGNRRVEAAAHNGLGILYREMGDYQRAREHYARSRDLIIQLGDQRTEGIIRGNLGVMLDALGEPEEALSELREATRIADAHGIRTSAASTRLRTAQVWIKAGDLKQAGELLTKSLEGAGKLTQADSHLLLSQLDRESGNFSSAASHLDLAIKLYEKRPSKQAAALHHRALLLKAQGDLDGAMTQLRAERRIRQELSSGNEEAEAVYRMAEIEMARGNLKSALTNARTAIALAEDLRARLSSGRRRMAFLSSRRDYYALAAAVLLKLDELHPDPVHVAEAFDLSERSRARGMLDSMQDSGGPATPLIEQLRFWANRYEELISGSRNAEPARQRVEELLREIRHQPSGPGGYTREPLTAAGVQRVLPPDTVLLQYLAGRDRYFLWRVEQNLLRAVRLEASAAGIRDAVKTYLDLAASPRSSGGPAAAEALSRMLLAPAGPLKGKRIIAAADGALYGIPFAALPGPESKRPLLADHDVFTTPSMSVSAAPSSKRATGPQKKVAVVADPVGPGDSRVWWPVQRPGAAAGPARLGYAAREAQQILALVPPGESLDARGFDAVPAVFESLKDYQIVHVASHTLIKPQPELSALVLTTVDRWGNPRDGYLRAHDIARSTLPARLVTLSACSTAAGTRFEGEGPLSLGSAFLQAGAEMALVSLWPVEDEATAALMGQFYKVMFQASTSGPASALRAAQQRIMSRDRWNHPYFWAGWVLLKGASRE